MIVVTQGSRTFNDYSIFLRAMLTSLSMMQPGDKEFTLYSVGPLRINQMSKEYINVSNFKARGIKARVMMVNEDFVKSNIDSVDYVTYFCNKGEPISGLIDFAEENGIEVGPYRY